MITYWFPKMFGKMMNETLGKIHFWGTVIPFNGIFIPLFVTGMAGDHRRIHNYKHFPELSTPMLESMREVATISLVILILFQAVFFANLIWSWLKGKPAGQRRMTGFTRAGPGLHTEWLQRHEPAE